MAALTLRVPPADLPIVLEATLTDAGSGTPLDPSAAYAAYEAALVRSARVVSEGETSALVAGVADAERVTFAFTAEQVALARERGASALYIVARAADGTLGPEWRYALALRPIAAEADATLQVAELTLPVNPTTDAAGEPAATGPAGDAGAGGGVTDHGALTGLEDDDHTQYALADGSRGAFAPTGHTHDDRYYTEAELDAALSSKADLVGGVVPTSQIPAVAITEYLGESADDAAMLALDGQRGDWTIRTDLGTVWVLSADDASLPGSWQELEYPGAPVTSINTQTGAVVLSAGDVGAATAAQGAKADSAVQPGDLHAVATSGSYDDLVGQPTIPVLPQTVTEEEAEAGTSTEPRIYTPALVTRAIDNATSGASGGYGTPLKSGLYYTRGGEIPAVDGTPFLNVLYLVPIIVASAGSVDGLAVWVRGAVTNASMRLGLYADTGAGMAGALLASPAAIDVSTPGLKTATFTALPLTPGRYWMAAVAQTATPSVRVYNAGRPSGSPVIGSADPSGSLQYFPTQDGVSGALPDPAIPDNAAGASNRASSPGIWLRAA